jgi:hypothetical protein
MEMAGALAGFVSILDRIYRMYLSRAGCRVRQGAYGARGREIIL